MSLVFINYLSGDGDGIAVLGPRWLGTVASAATLHRSPQWTQREIQAALAGGTRVIPVLLDQTPQLSSDDLPSALAPVAKRQYIRFEHTDVDSAMDRLTAVLARQVPGHNCGSLFRRPAVARLPQLWP